MRTALLIAALFVLAASLAAGATIYFLADEADATSYVIVGDTAYAVDPASSKNYVRQLERFGGKASVLFDDINRFLASLWHGKRLGPPQRALTRVNSCHVPKTHIRRGRVRRVITPGPLTPRELQPPRGVFF